MVEEEKVSIDWGRYHIDLIQRIVSIDEDSDTVTIALEPDPRKYKWEEIDGKWFLVDTFDPAIFAAEDFFDILKRAFRTPVYHEIRNTSDAELKKKSLRILITRKITRE